MRFYTNEDGASYTLPVAYVSGIEPSKLNQLKDKDYLYIPNVTPNGIKVVGIKDGAFKNVLTDAVTSSYGLIVNCTQNVTYFTNSTDSFNVVKTGDTNQVSQTEEFTFGNNAFEGCTGIRSIVLPFYTQSIGDFLFKGCTNLQDVKSGDKTGTEDGFGKMHVYNSKVGFRSLGEKAFNDTL
jgi:hypothetical protein